MANTITAFDPTIWSREGIAILREKIQMPKLVRRDFQNDLAQAGDVVNTRKPATMTAGDVDDTSGITAQDVSATNVAVQLNSHKHATFKIKDREASRSISNLVTEYLDPAMLAIANAIDRSLLGLYTDATLGVTLSSAGDWRTRMSTARVNLNKNKAPEDNNRSLVLSDDDEGALGNLDILSKVNESGSGAALREGSVGRVKGFNVYRSSNVLSIGSPAVRHNLAFHQDAIALVTRTLGTATGRTPGAEQTVAVSPDAGLSMRVTISYNHSLLSMLISVDLLYGVKTLDSNLLVKLKASF